MAVIPLLRWPLLGLLTPSGSTTATSTTSVRHQNSVAAAGCLGESWRVTVVESRDVQRCPEMSTESTSIWVYLIIVDYRWLSTWHYIFTTCKESRSIKWPAMNPGPPHLQREPHLRRRLQRCQTHRQGRHCPSPPLLIRALVSQQTQRKIISTRLPWSWKMLILWTAQEWRNPSKRHTCWLESHPCSRCQRVSLKPMVRTKQC